MSDNRARVQAQTADYWEIIAPDLKKADWSWGIVAAIDCQGRTIWIVDAHRYGKRFVVRADEMLTAFLELESTIRTAERPQDCGGRKNKVRQTVADRVKASSITSSDVSTHLRPD